MSILAHISLWLARTGTDFPLFGPIFSRIFIEGITLENRDRVCLWSKRQVCLPSIMRDFSSQTQGSPPVTQSMCRYPSGPIGDLSGAWEARGTKKNMLTLMPLLISNNVLWFRSLMSLSPSIKLWQENLLVCK